MLYNKVLEEIMRAITYSQARQHLAEQMQTVVDNHESVLITRSNGDNCVLMSEALFNSLEETAYLLRSPANTKHLLDSIKELQQGHTVAFKELED
ncbi:type II toxin-antitoxin system prevent-host-death family antitoxin [Oligella sp. MSHR50489EDL]|uniref:type II toxin-antitoxin system prevent-host-death family antitoxin n=1 Tax=Oligella sp. MSHR50489EDL TaxID=3139409 RepID=UPI003D816C35